MLKLVEGCLFVDSVGYSITEEKPQTVWCITLHDLSVKFRSWLSHFNEGFVDFILKVEYIFHSEGLIVISPVAN